MKTVEGTRMMSSVKGIWLTCTAAALLLGWNLQGIQGHEWFYPNPPIKSDHLRNQSFVNCAEKRFFEVLNVSIKPTKIEHCTQSVDAEGAWIPSEDILYIECSGSVFLDGVEIAGPVQDTSVCRHREAHCPMLKGKLYRQRLLEYPLPCVMNKGDYLLKGRCKNQDGDIILCGKWSFTWV